MDNEYPILWEDATILTRSGEKWCASERTAYQPSTRVSGLIEMVCHSQELEATADTIAINIIIIILW